MPEMRTTYELARQCFRNAKIQNANPSFWKFASTEFKQKLPQMAPFEISLALNSFARMRYRDKDLLTKISFQTAVDLPAFSHTDLTYLLTSFAYLETRSDLLFSAACKDICRKLHGLTPRQLSEILFAFSSVKYLSNHLFFDVFLAECRRKAPSFPQRNLCVFLNSLSKLLTYNVLSQVPLFAIFSLEVMKQIEQLESTQLAIVTTSFSRVGFSDAFFWQILRDEVAKRKGEFSTKLIGMILFALRRDEETPIFENFTSMLIKRGRAKRLDGNLLTISLILASLAHRRATNAEDLQELTSLLHVEVVRQSSEMSPKILANLVLSYGFLSRIHSIDHTGELLAQTPKQLEIWEGELDFQDFHKLVLGCSLAGQAPSDLLTYISDQILSRDFSHEDPKKLVDLARSCQYLMIGDSRHFQKLTSFDVKLLPEKDQEFLQGENWAFSSPEALRLQQITFYPDTESD